MTPSREERIEAKIDKICTWIFDGNGNPPATVRLALLERFKYTVCWIAGSIFVVVILGGGIKLMFMLFNHG